MRLRSAKVGAALSALTAAVTIVAVATGCTSTAPAQTQTAVVSPTRLDGDYSESGPGTLKSAETAATVDRRITRVAAIAARITYESKSGIDGSPQVVSGTVFSPSGQPPPDGWPIIAFGHNSTGVQHECGPSMSSSLLGESEAVAGLVKAGYVVTLPDYQGLGLDDTYHPYLDATTAGYNMVDAVRAARKLVPFTSDRWLAYGSSQGGQASWSANELAGSGYASGLHLVGSVSVAPAADITGLVDVAAAGKLTIEQAGAYQWILVALKNEHPELNLDDYRRGIVADQWDVLSACQGPLTSQRVDVTKQMTPDDLRPASPAAADLLRGYLRQMGLPKTQTQAPMLVLFGDMDQLIAAQWTQDAVKRACTMGDVVLSYLAPGHGHDDIDGSTALDWISQRFAGNDPPNSCTQPDPTVRLSAKPWYADG